MSALDQLRGNEWTDAPTPLLVRALEELAARVAVLEVRLEMLEDE